MLLSKNTLHCLQRFVNNPWNVSVKLYLHQAFFVFEKGQVAAFCETNREIFCYLGQVKSVST